MSYKEELVEEARARAGHIHWFYKQFADKKPVMLLELPSEKIYAYPYLEFRKTLSERSAKMLEKEYEEALARKQFVIFVKDTDRRKMISFSIDEA